MNRTQKKISISKQEHNLICPAMGDRSVTCLPQVIGNHLTEEKTHSQNLKLNKLLLTK